MACSRWRASNANDPIKVVLKCQLTKANHNIGAENPLSGYLKDAFLMAM